MFRVRLHPFEQGVACAADETFLAAALRAGLYVPYGCKTGGCGTCKMRLLEGEITDRSGPLALTPQEHEEGWFLPCVTKPLSDCVIDASAQDERTLLASERPVAFTTELVKNEPATHDIQFVRLRLVEPEAIRFTAGQFVNVEVPGSQDVRTYSLANPPSQNGHLDLYVRRRPQGRFSGLLEEGLPLGARLRVFGPFGQLRVRLSHRPIVMVASGSGLAPMLSMLADLVEKRNVRPVRLFFRAQTREDLFALDQLAEIGRATPGFELVPILRAPEQQERALTEALVDHLGSARDHDAYVGGSPWCIETTLPALLGLGVRRRNIYFDVFMPASP